MRLFAVQVLSRERSALAALLRRRVGNQAAQSRKCSRRTIAASVVVPPTNRRVLEDRPQNSWLSNWPRIVRRRTRVPWIGSAATLGCHALTSGIRTQRPRHWTDTPEQSGRREPSQGRIKRIREYEIWFSNGATHFTGRAGRCAGRWSWSPRGRASHDCPIPQLLVDSSSQHVGCVSFHERGRLPDGDGEGGAIRPDHLHPHPFVPDRLAERRRRLIVVVHGCLL